jgi:hypothetical protein
LQEHPKKRAWHSLMTTRRLVSAAEEETCLYQQVNLLNCPILELDWVSCRVSPRKLVTIPVHVVMMVVALE